MVDRCPRGIWRRGAWAALARGYLGRNGQNDSSAVAGTRLVRSRDQADSVSTAPCCSPEPSWSAPRSPQGSPAARPRWRSSWSGCWAWRTSLPPRRSWRPSRRCCSSRSAPRAGARSPRPSPARCRCPPGSASRCSRARAGAFPRSQSDVELLSDLRDVVSRLGGYGVVGAIVLPLTVLATAWLAGLALRFLDRATTSREHAGRGRGGRGRRAGRDRAGLEIARLREEQARLARDVHDVVGHSLAVILAQAESAQYLPDDDPARSRRRWRTIASSARASLQDVRHVLARPRGRRPGRRAFDEPDRRGARQRHELVLDRGPAPRTRCRRSSTWSPTGCCRRC